MLGCLPPQLDSLSGLFFCARIATLPLSARVEPCSSQQKPSQLLCFIKGDSLTLSVLPSLFPCIQLSGVETSAHKPLYCYPAFSPLWPSALVLQSLEPAGNFLSCSSYPQPFSTWLSDLGRGQPENPSCCSPGLQPSPRKHILALAAPTCLFPQLTLAAWAHQLSLTQWGSLIIYSPRHCLAFLIGEMVHLLWHRGAEPSSPTVASHSMTGCV